MEYDVFISHASEDKEKFVHILAQKLQEKQLLIWYDDFELQVGSGLRKSIDYGLSKSRFGIVILSKNFFRKQWPNWELDGLVARQNSSENDLILPIWLDITRDDVLEYSPSLADKVAIAATKNIDIIVEQLLKVIKPQGSTLVIARDILFKHGMTPPLVTDDWWLDVVQYSGDVYMHHEYLSFDMGWLNGSPQEKGIFIAGQAMQMQWQTNADDLYLSQITPPKDILAFIETNPGLKEFCLDQPKRIAFYFPQLTIKGLGGFLEKTFDDVIENSIASNGHECDEAICLRHPTFGNRDAGEVADIYFAGASGGIGPSNRRLEHFEYIIWLLSSASSWLPENIHQALLKGLQEWGVWAWVHHLKRKYEDVPGGFDDTGNSSKLFHAMHDSLDQGKGFKMTKAAIKDIKEQIAFCKWSLNLSDDVDDLYDKFVSSKTIEIYLEKYWKRKQQ